MAPGLSARAARLVALPKPSFTSIYYASLDKLYDPVSRPAGIVNLGVAENRLSAPLVKDRLDSANSGVSFDSLAYNPYTGSERLRVAMARVASRHIARCSIDHKRLILTSGAGSSLWILAASLAEPGQGILVPTPYYYAYDRDFGALTDCQVVPFNTNDRGDPLNPEALSTAVHSASSSGIKCRLLVVTNPSNPTGEVVPACKLQATIDWAGRNGIDVIVNELYACSARSSTFQSVLSMYSDPSGVCNLPPHVHFVWGLSKDFAVNGLRVGCLYSGSDLLTEAASKFAYFVQIGGTVQAQLSECLEDDDWVDDFLAESRRRVGQAVAATEAALQSIGAPTRPSDGALFVWADLGEWATAAGGELRLFEHLAALPGGGVLICPGSSFQAPTEGWFRICATAAPGDHLSVGLKRLIAGLASVGSKRCRRGSA